MEEDKKEKKQEKKEDLQEKIEQQVEEQIKKISNEGINSNNIEMLYELVDIHKDIENEKYWNKKKEVMEMRYYDDLEYGNYDGYGARRRDSRGRYMARGVRRYRGNDIIEEMKEHYGNYMEGAESGYRGPETDKAFDYMLQSAEDFFKHLMEESESPEQMEKLKRTAKKIGEMRM